MAASRWARSLISLSSAAFPGRQVGRVEAVGQDRDGVDEPAELPAVAGVVGNEARRRAAVRRRRQALGTLASSGRSSSPTGAGVSPSGPGRAGGRPTQPPGDREGHEHRVAWNRVALHARRTPSDAARARRPPTEHPNGPDLARARRCSPERLHRGSSCPARGPASTDTSSCRAGRDRPLMQL